MQNQTRHPVSSVFGRIASRGASQATEEVSQATVSTICAALKNIGVCDDAGKQTTAADDDVDSLALGVPVATVYKAPDLFEALGEPVECPYRRSGNDSELPEGCTGSVGRKDLKKHPPGKAATKTVGYVRAVDGGVFHPAQVSVGPGR